VPALPQSRKMVYIALQQKRPREHSRVAFQAGGVPGWRAPACRGRLACAITAPWRPASRKIRRAARLQSRRQQPSPTTPHRAASAVEPGPFHETSQSILVEQNLPCLRHLFLDPLRCPLRGQRTGPACRRAARRALGAGAGTQGGRRAAQGSTPRRRPATARPAAPPFHGSITHRGWRVVDTRLPKLTGSHELRIVAPAEVEL
jgi:hypothetical protein